MNSEDIKSMKQDDFLVDEDKVKAMRKTEGIKPPPANYIKVKLSSLGKLSAPAILHFRDYIMEEAYDLAYMNTNLDNQDDIIISILNKLVWEDFDCGDLHREEVKEIMLNIYGAYWSPVIETLRYYINEDLEGSALKHKDNTSVATIPIKNIRTTEIPDQFKEPFFLSKGSDKIGFVLPRIKNSVIAKNYIEELFASEEKKFSGIKYDLEHNKHASEEKQRIIDFDKLKEYTDYTRKKLGERLKIYQAQMLYSINGKELTSIEDKYKVAGTLGLKLWTELTQHLDKDLHFGIEDEVEFECSISHKPIKRRFQFRELDFVPPVDTKQDPQYTLSFS